MAYPLLSTQPSTPAIGCKPLMAFAATSTAPATAAPATRIATVTPRLLLSLGIVAAEQGAV